MSPRSDEAAGPTYVTKDQSFDRDMDYIRDRITRDARVRLFTTLAR